MIIPPVAPPFAPPVPPAPAAPDLAGPGVAVGGSAPGAAPSFADELRGALNQMQDLQSDATTQVSHLVTGTSEDVHAGMIAVEKADLAFGMMLQLRNKAVAAYQDISHMQF